MPKITINTDEHKKFFSSALGQAVLTELSKTADLETLKAIVNCEYTSKGTIEDIVKRLTESELIKIEKNGEYDKEVFYVIMSATSNKSTGRITLDIIYNFAMKLIMIYQVGSTPYDMAMDMIKWLAINPNTNEQTLQKIKANNAHLVKHIVQNVGIRDKWLIELVEDGTNEEKLAAIPELVRRLKTKI